MNQELSEENMQMKLEATKMQMNPAIK